jgi:hypothetical protein
VTEYSIYYNLVQYLQNLCNRLSTSKFCILSKSFLSYCWYSEKITPLGKRRKSLKAQLLDIIINCIVNATILRDHCCTDAVEKSSHRLENNQSQD